MANVSGRIGFNNAMGQVLSGLPYAPGQTAPPTLSAPIAVGCSFKNGVGAGQVDLKYTKRLDFVANTPQVLDLKSLTDVNGGAVAFAKVRSIAIKLFGLVDGVTLKLGYANTTANAWTALVTNPGQVTLQAFPAGQETGFLILAPGLAGYAVTASNKLLNLDPGAAAFSIEIEICGTSA